MAEMIAPPQGHTATPATPATKMPSFLHKTMIEGHLNPSHTAHVRCMHSGKTFYRVPSRASSIGILKLGEAIVLPLLDINLPFFFQLYGYSFFHSFSSPTGSFFGPRSSQYFIIVLIHHHVTSRPVWRYRYVFPPNLHTGQLGKLFHHCPFGILGSV